MLAWRASESAPDLEAPVRTGSALSPFLSRRGTYYEETLAALGAIVEFPGEGRECFVGFFVGKDPGGLLGVGPKGQEIFAVLDLGEKLEADAAYSNAWYSRHKR